MEGQGVEKLIASKMMLPGSNRRIHSVHRHAGMVLFHVSIQIFICLYSYKMKYKRVKT